jgi:hypothetical protein
MSLPPNLTDFVRRALLEGQSPDRIRAALLDAGWTETESTAALSAWHLGAAGPVPRPVRSGVAREALFYAMLFVAFGMVAGNVLSLLFGQANFWMPEPDERYYRFAISGLRWSMAALIVFAPAFWLLNRADERASAADPARSHGTMRRWLGSLALLVAVLTLMGDALFLIYTLLDGQMTARFLVKSAIVAGIAAVVLAYFRQDRGLPLLTRFQSLGPVPSHLVLLGLAVLALGLSLWTIGGPAQGRAETRDRWRMDDLRALANDLSNCALAPKGVLPETLDPMACARNPRELAGYAGDVTYERLSDTRFRLCIPVEFPPAIDDYSARIDGDIVCLDHVARFE